MYRQPIIAKNTPRRVRNRLPAGAQYMGEDDTYVYYVEPGANPTLDGFTNMFKRMVKFTPKSFTPGNIYKGFVNTTLTVATGGAYQILPKNIKKVAYEVGKIAIPVVAGGVLAVTAGPAVMAMLGPKLSAAGGLIGKGASAIGGPLFNLLGKFTGAQQAQIAQQVTPEQIAYMDQTGGIPSSLLPLLNAMSAQSLPAQTGAASLYNPELMGAPVQEEEGTDWGMLALLGVPVVLFGAMVVMKR